MAENHKNPKSKTMQEAYIVAGYRTAVGKSKRGKLRFYRPDDLAIDVIKDSPAAKAEVKVHDILLSLAGKVLDSQEKLVELVQANGEK